jgi:drug/metabolite transporter (DMT)-like permease
MLLVQPVVAALIGAIVYAEQVTVADAIGAAGIAAAILLVREQPLRARPEGLG